MSKPFMIKAEHIKQAIDKISLRDRMIAQSLATMLSEGRIAAPFRVDDDDGFFFFFEGEKVLVNKYLFFDRGTVPIEQGLLIKYGEFVKRQEIVRASEPTGHREASEAVREAGLRLAVTHEIDYATARVEGLLRNMETQGLPASKHPDDGRPLRRPEAGCDRRSREPGAKAGEGPAKKGEERKRQERKGSEACHCQAMLGDRFPPGLCQGGSHGLVKV